jgi:hypothetical protein
MPLAISKKCYSWIHKLIFYHQHMDIYNINDLTITSDKYIQVCVDGNYMILLL